MNLSGAVTAIASVTLRALYGYQPGWGQPDPATCEAIMALMRGTAPRGGSAPASPTSSAG